MDDCLLLVLIGRTHTRRARVMPGGTGPSAGGTPTSGPSAQAGPDLQPAPALAHDLSQAGSPAELAARLGPGLAIELAAWIKTALVNGRGRVLLAASDDVLGQRVARQLTALGIEHISRLVPSGTPGLSGDVHAIPLVVGGGQDGPAGPLDAGHMGAGHMGAGHVGAGAVGADRLLAALGASARLGQAVAVVDAGALVTIDLCDRHGVLAGSALAPGLGAMLEATHNAAARSLGTQVPLVARPPAAAALPTGNMSLDVADAAVLGAVHALRGFVRYQVELMAEASGLYPRVLATGPDAALLLEHDELIEHVVPDLGLIGMLEAWRRLNTDDDLAASNLSPEELEDELDTRLGAGLTEDDDA